MPPAEPFQYDAFISYSHTDRPCAKQLADDLTARNLKVFYDRRSLDVGDPWAEQLDDSLDVSQHLIVLWSGNSRSDYVDYERTYFRAKARAVARSQSDLPSRKEILILLEDPPPKVGTYRQIIKTLKENAKAKGFENRDLNDWQSVVAQVDKTIRDQSDALPILVAVLATTRDFLNNLDFDKRFRFIGSMNEIIARMGISSKADLLNYYGDTRDDWCPFGNNANIWAVLDNVRTRVAQATKNKFQIDFEPIGNDLWSEDFESAQAEASRLVGELSLVVIDPISLVDDCVISALELIEGCFNNLQTAVMVLTPFRMLEPSASLREIIERRAISFSSLFYRPPVPPNTTLANFGVNIGDEIDMNRLVLMTLGQSLGMQKARNSIINP